MADSKSLRAARACGRQRMPLYHLSALPVAASGSLCTTCRCYPVAAGGSLRVTPSVAPATDGSSLERGTPT
ncbi:hypothetical protein Areg01_33500 [Actinoplanes regularis]|nr:hypothetical protein Areg01_33500 [Actinoplanes regularis]